MYMSGCMMGSGAHTAAGPAALCGRSSQVRQPVAAPLLLTTTPCVSRAQLGDHITERECTARTPFCFYTQNREWVLFLYSKQDPLSEHFPAKMPNGAVVPVGSEPAVEIALRLCQRV